MAEIFCNPLFWIILIILIASIILIKIIIQRNKKKEIKKENSLSLVIDKECTPVIQYKIPDGMVSDFELDINQEILVEYFQKISTLILHKIKEFQKCENMEKKEKILNEIINLRVGLIKLIEDSFIFKKDFEWE